MYSESTNKKAIGSHLDEPTASLDSQNEKLIFDTLKQLSKKMTVVVATHQEKLIKLADIHISLNKKAGIHELI